MPGRIVPEKYGVTRRLGLHRADCPNTRWESFEVVRLLRCRCDGVERKDGYGFWWIEYKCRYRTCGLRVRVLADHAVGQLKVALE